ncbi:MAG: hypothetical protein AAF357_04110 [Verrucomicrobiota bacterium]
MNGKSSIRFLDWASQIPTTIWAFLMGPIPAIRLRGFEIIFSTAYLYYFFIARFWYWEEWLTPHGFHYTQGAHPSFHISPFPLLQPWAALLFGILNFIAGSLVLSGRRRRLGLFLLFLSAVYIQNADALSAFALNIHFIVGFAVLSLSPMERQEVDGSEPWIQSAWPLRILQATILLQLFTAGWSKYQNVDWIVQHDVLWSHAQGPYRNEFSAWLLQIVPMRLWTIMQWFALLFELVGPFLIIIPYTRWLGLLWGLGFVSFIALAMDDLTFFMLQHIRLRSQREVRLVLLRKLRIDSRNLFECAKRELFSGILGLQVQVQRRNL